MNRKQRRAANSGGSPASGFRAGRSPSATQTDLFHTAVMHHHAGALAEAERCYRQVLAAAPGHAEAHSRLGAVMMRQGRTAEAIAHIEQALALNRNMFEAYGNLAQAYLSTGQNQRAIEAASRALELKETPQSKAMFAQCVGFARFNADDGRYRRLVLRALVEAWARPRELTRACISLIVLQPATRDAIARAQAAWPRLLTEAELFEPSGMAALARDNLMCRLLETDPITDLGLERLLTNARHAMLKEITLSPPRAGRGDDSLLAFYCSVARQCFLNEYVFATTEDEDERVQGLRTALEAALEAGEPVPAFWLAAVGAYFPLHALTKAQHLLEHSWPKSVEALLSRQIKEPAEERRIASTIPVLTTIDDEVSRAVRQQYEESPYPRWTKGGPAGQPPVLGDRNPQRSVDVLIAGCGTGLSTTEFARHVRNARVLAIDLSIASLSYAKRMARNFGLADIEFAQADIMKLASLGRAFDFIDASGVLHHLGDPWQGWRILLSLLRPGGTMEVGLYSERGRRNVVAARALIAERGYRPVAADIRRCREEVAEAEDGSLLKSLVRSDDFFSMSECRDLLFHPQEHRLTLPEIKAFLAANGLQFVGFALPPPVLRNFAKRFPEPAAITDLDRWDTFESEAPGTFAGMYLFSVRKPATPSPGSHNPGRAQ